MDTITPTPFTFKSADNTSTIHALFWIPEGTPRGIIQLVHGMAEHIGRYEEFASWLAGKGFLVAGHDQIGHGLSAKPKDLGHISITAGKASLLADIHQVRLFAIAKAAEILGVEANIADDESPLPFFLLGHSMGAFEVQVYISHYGEGLSGAIICGGGYVDPVTSAAGNKFAHLLALLNGHEMRSKMLHNMGMGTYSKGVEHPLTELDWLSYNRDNVNDYISDELSGAMFSAGGYAALTSLTEECCQLSCALGVPKDLPLLFIAGEDDPVGDMGEGVKKAYDLARAAGTRDLSCKIYSHMRHEILNEYDALKVYGDVLDWIEERL